MVIKLKGGKKIKRNQNIVFYEIKSKVLNLSQEFSFIISLTLTEEQFWEAIINAIRLFEKVEITTFNCKMQAVFRGEDVRRCN